MKKPVVILVGTLTIAVGWIFFKHFRIEGLTNLRVTPVSVPGKGSWFEASGPSTPAATSGTLRIASFNVSVFDDAKSRDDERMDVLARIALQFDVMAIQGIRAESDQVLPRFIDDLRQRGGQYDYAIGPRLGPAGEQEQYGFLFNTRKVQFDRAELYTVADHDDLLLREPLVGWFRTMGPPENEAFTFTLVNVKIEPHLVLQETPLLHPLLVAIRNDGRNEDDVILAGDLQAEPHELAGLNKRNSAAFAVRDQPTNTAGDATWSNLYFLKTATTEYTGNSGVFDFLREYNLELEKAAEISNHLPVWAEFSIVEGGPAGRVAADAASISAGTR